MDDYDEVQYDIHLRELLEDRIAQDPKNAHTWQLIGKSLKRNADIIMVDDYDEGVEALWPLLGSPEERAEKMLAHHDRAGRLTHWMRHIPVVGQLVETFWFCLLTEGVRETLKPRWGALTFSFLNDGMKPTLWHTWHSVTCRRTVKYDPVTGKTDSCDACAIWPNGAPRNAREAFRKE